MKLRCIHLTLFLTIASVWFSTNIFTSNPATPMFSVLSWNILGPNTQDAKNFFPLFKNPYDRLDSIKQTIDPRTSILCLQEVDAESLKRLASKLTNFFVAAHQSKGQNGGVAIFAKKTVFDEKQSNGKGIILKNRTSNNKKFGAAASAVLKSKKTGATIGVTSMHISRPGAWSATNCTSGEEQLLALLSNLDFSIPQIITGDFNTDDQEMIAATIPFINANTGQQFVEMFTTPGIQTASQANHTFSKIDHLLYTANLTPVMQYSKILPDKFNPAQLVHEQVPSDHRPLYGVFVDGISNSATAQPAPAPLPAPAKAKTIMPKNTHALGLPAIPKFQAPPNIVNATHTIHQPTKTSLENCESPRSRYERLSRELKEIDRLNQVLLNQENRAEELIDFIVEEQEHPDNKRSNELARTVKAAKAINLSV